MTGWRLWRLAGISGIVLFHLACCLPGGAATLSCAEAARIAEDDSALPAGLLLAIGLVESGRTDGMGRRLPWPWTINAGGLGRFFETADDAVRAVRALQASGVRSVDIGCFQINLLHHPHAFGDLVSGFDPLTNARAAARFLLTLRDEFGDWQAAIAAYHSRADVLGAPYRERVLAAWHGAPWRGVSGPRVVTVASVRVPSVQVSSVQVWGPGGQSGFEVYRSAWQHVFVRTGGAKSRLPRVITGATD